MNQSKPEIYIQSGDGKFYREEDDGSYTLAEEGVEIEEIGPGRFVRVTSDDKARSYLEINKGHEGYFNKMDLEAKKDPRQVKQDFKRLNALNRRLGTLGSDMVFASPSGPNIEFIKDEKFLDLMAMYGEAVKKGEQKNCEFQPVTAYQHRLTTKSGRKVRDLWAGEVGMKGPIVLCLEAGYGTGGSTQVPVEMNHDNRGGNGDHQSVERSRDVQPGLDVPGGDAVSGEIGGGGTPGPVEP